MRHKRYVKAIVIIFSSSLVLLVALNIYNKYILTKSINSVNLYNASIDVSNINETLSSNISQVSNNNNTNDNVSNQLSIYYSISKKSISLGMTKEEVDKLLGLQEKKDFKNMYDYHGLEIFYRNDKIAGLVINSSKNETARYKTNKMIGLGNNKDDVIKAYGEN